MARRTQPGQKRISQADVARRAGVSTGIVSSVINGRNRSIPVSDATRERVLVAVRELGYVPDIAARNLARGSNRLIGVFTYEAIFPIESQDFYHQLLIGIEEAADQAKYHLLLVTGARNEDHRRSIYADGVNHLRLADGGLLLGTNESAAEITRLAAESYPFVFVGERAFPGVELSYVAADYLEGTANLVGRAVDLGHRRIAMGIVGPSEAIPGRQAGFVEARGRHGLAAHDTPMILAPKKSTAADPSGATPTVDEFVSELIRLEATAVVLENSMIYPELRAALDRQGIRVPGDLSIIGLSGAQSRDDQTELTTLDIPRREMGREATRLLLELLTTPDPGPLRTRLNCGIYQGTTLAPKG